MFGVPYVESRVRAASQVLYVFQVNLVAIILTNIIIQSNSYWEVQNTELTIAC